MRYFPSLKITPHKALTDRLKGTDAWEADTGLMVSVSLTITLHRASSLSLV